MSRRETLTERVTRILAENIRSGTYPQGQRLPSEQAMVDEFGVSRTVVREAIANLRASGKVSTVPGIGIFVRESIAPVTDAFAIRPESLTAAASLLNVLELRLAVESEAVMLASQRRTQQHLDDMRQAIADMLTAIDQQREPFEADLRFHRTIAEATDNQEFVRLFNYIGGLLIPRTQLRSQKLDDKARLALRNRMETEHEHICYALQRHDADAARALLRLHLSSSRNRLRESLSRTS
ncbi:FadR family transcriptional regulator [Alcaligenes sp. 13f]|uniref:FadR/GntR family transcriptional regulator n=1 Tax=Alcaligenes sp. 13f TaxID=2841924 RepID=UPI001CF6E927|nr:FadR/GntR family transcriptional regulator [Alcaligenes sp. 13f]MCB4321971.1 FadR family transcriptional regulator [Alcaligenes sp. 13f]